METRKLMIVLTAAMLLVSGYFFYRERLPIEAKIWHLRYGNWLQVSDYDVPVPSEWLVRRGPDEGPIMLIDTRVDRVPGINAIVISFDRRSPVNVETLQSLREDWLRAHGVSDIEEKRLQTNVQTAICLSNHELREVMPVAGLNIVTAECLSSTRIRLSLTGDSAGLEKLYAIVSGIRKRG